MNQSFNDQFNSIQILEQLAPLQLAKEHLPGDIVDILKRLGKADNIPFNQLYYIVESCANCYYSKVIETFVALLKRQFVDRQLLLVNTARSLKFLEEYADRQALIWKIFQRHENIPDDIQDLHFHIDDFKTNIEKEFSLLKEATCKNVENFQSSLNTQQTYSVALCSHVNNIYNKLAEIQQQLPHSVNTARSLKFLEEYADRHALIWKIFQKHENIPDDIQDLHFYIDDFKTNIEKEFLFLKEATCKNVENFQSSLNTQQTYSMALCSHVNNIYNKLAEIQQQLPHSAQHMNTGDAIQIEVPDFDPDIDEALPIQDHQEAQGSANITQQFFKKSAKSKAPASSHQDVQDVDWPDMIPVEILPQPNQDIEQNIPTVTT